MTRVAFACDSYDALARRVVERTLNGTIQLTTRHRPRRHAELVGGSLYWILRHRLVARSEIVGFAEAEDGRTAILLDPRLVPVEPVPRRAHQGWRYLQLADAPRDLADISGDGDALPPALSEQLAEIGLV